MRTLSAVPTTYIELCIYLPLNKGHHLSIQDSQLIRVPPQITFPLYYSMVLLCNHDTLPLALQKGEQCHILILHAVHYNHSWYHIKRLGR